MRLLGIDIGGTFTDLVLFDSETDSLTTHKLLTTADDPVRAVLEGTRHLLETAGPPGPERVIHGTTLVTNAVVERKGAATALLTTRGFRDVLEIRREGRYDLYDLDLEFPPPLVPRRRRFEAAERIAASGEVIEPLDTDALDRLLERTATERTNGKDVAADRNAIASWAVCFLHAYANPDHEQAAAERIRRAFPGVPVSVSSEVAPEIREYERTSTTVANAYVRPIAEGYLNRLHAGLDALIPETPALHIMLSDGGITTPDTAARFPIRIVESGPAGGVLAAGRVGSRIATRLVSLDMGGTTAKIAFLDAEGPRTRSEFEVDRRHVYKKGSGLPVLIPALDMVEIGAGGGSIASRSALGTLTVGPESAGADPGPACYGRGGTRATVTDADLVLGLLDPGYFLGGAMPLNAAAARAAVERDVAGPLGLGVLDAAHGVHTLVGSNMAEAARVHAAERGLDLAAHTLVAFGGAGPVHAWSIARQLRIPRVLFPGHAGVASALGFLAAGPAFEVARSRTESLDALDAAASARVLGELAAEARAVVDPGGAGDVTVSATVDMRYRGQGAEVRVPLSGLAPSPEDLRRGFGATYRAAYGRDVAGVPVEVVTWRVRCTRPAAAVGALDRAGDAAAEQDAPPPHAERTAWLPDEDAPAPVPVYRRDALVPGMSIAGPALVEESQCTLVLGRGTARVLPGGAVLAELWDAAPREARTAGAKGSGSPGRPGSEGVR
jgi:N-methylhydantoinase A